VFLKYIYYKRKLFYLLSVFFLIFIATFYFYDIPVAAVLYPTFLCLLIGAVFLTVDFFVTKEKVKFLSSIEKMGSDLCAELPDAQSIRDEQYEKLIKMLCVSQKENLFNASVKYNDMIDYYTVWAHQIKTPIASMRLNLQNEDSPHSRRLQNDLNRIEGYVNMVLTFLRLDSDSSDYVFCQCDLDKMIKESVKKFSGEFIYKKLSLNYTPVKKTVLTDEKWFCFVIEQVISNCIKYTEKGNITIDLVGESLIISDTGIGIMPEDLPRVFENGYTGFTGRKDKRASGIGLFLCKRICDNLGHNISISSIVGEGTSVKIGLERKNSLVE